MDEDDQRYLLAQAEKCRQRAKQMNSAHDQVRWTEVAELIDEFCSDRGSGASKH
jgi:hypothetical protein